MTGRLLDWIKPRRLLVRDLAEMVAETRELREAAVRRAKDNEALRVELSAEWRRTDERQGLEHIGYVHPDSDYQPAFLPTPCSECRPLFLGPPMKETP